MLNGTALRGSNSKGRRGQGSKNAIIWRGIPELQSSEDINWLRECMLIGADEAYATKHFTQKIDVALATRTTQLNNAVHILAHS